MLPPGALEDRGVNEIWAGIEEEVTSAMCLRACYAMPGTDLAYGAMCLRAYYAIPGTDRAYGSMRCAEDS
eukprot:2857511-Rhodomonas_salina.1